MTRQLEQVREDKQRKHDQELVAALEFGLVEGLERAGASLSGFSMKYNPAECLITIRAEMAGRPQIAFVGAGSMSDCFIKSSRLAVTDKLNWRADKFSVKSG